MQRTPVSTDSVWADNALYFIPEVRKQDVEFPTDRTARSEAFFFEVFAFQGDSIDCVDHITGLKRACADGLPALIQPTGYRFAWFYGESASTTEL